MATQLLLRRGTAAEWAAANPILARGEPGYATDTRALKIGDGATAWDALPAFKMPNDLAPADIGAAPAEHGHAWAAISGTPTTLAGYGLDLGPSDIGAATAAQGALAATAVQPDDIAYNGSKFTINDSEVGPRIDFDTFNARLSASSADPEGLRNASSSTLYLTAYDGTLISLFDTNLGRWETFTISEITLNLADLTAFLPYDVYLRVAGGNLELSLTAWTNATTRTIEPMWRDGRLVRGSDNERQYRYIGTILPATATTVTDSESHRGIWNLKNRVPKRLATTYPTTSHQYQTSAWREWNTGTSRTGGYAVFGYKDYPVIAFRASVDRPAGGLAAAIYPSTLLYPTPVNSVANGVYFIVTSGPVEVPQGYSRFILMQLGASYAYFASPTFHLTARF